MKEPLRKCALNSNGTLCYDEQQSTLKAKNTDVCGKTLLSVDDISLSYWVPTFKDLVNFLNVSWLLDESARPSSFIFS